VIAWINSQPYKSSTKEDLKILVRKLVQYAKCGSCGRNTPVPPEVSWFSINRSEKDSKVKPEMLLSLEDVKAMINAAENERDRALISVLFEAALRPSELLTMKVGSVKFRENYCLISVCGKTGVKRIPLVASYRLLLDWLMKHPKENDPDAPLWISLSNNSKSEAMSYYYFRKLVKELAERAGLLKGVEGIARLSPSFVDDIYGRYNRAVKRVWECLHTLLRKGLVRRVFLSMFLGSRWQARSKVSYWELTDRGRIIARRIRFEVKREDEVEGLIRGAYFEEALRRLWREKVAAGLPPAATAGEVLEALWSVVRDLYEGSRELFEGAWSRKRIGVEMRRRGYRQVQIRLNGEVTWVYMLYGVEERLHDLGRALELLRQRGITTPNTGQIREALWETCREKLQTREAFEKVWTAENIGRLMRRLGAKRIRARPRSPPNDREWLYLSQL
ncbi:MAG: tyrosine-type recombinase/integrase, partial [Candidatus Bathyarchaeia archaeon]